MEARGPENLGVPIHLQPRPLESAIESSPFDPAGSIVRSSLAAGVAALDIIQFSQSGFDFSQLDSKLTQILEKLNSVSMEQSTMKKTLEAQAGRSVGETTLTVQHSLADTGEGVNANQTLGRSRMIEEDQLITMAHQRADFIGALLSKIARALNYLDSAKRFDEIITVMLDVPKDYIGLSVAAVKAYLEGLGYNDLAAKLNQLYALMRST